MKKSYFWHRLLFVAVIISNVFGCRKNTPELSLKTGPGCGLSCVDYEILQDASLQQDQNGNWNTVFVWRVTNPCPGNGKNGTLQNLSHWSFTPSQCFNPEVVLGAWVDTTSGNGTAWMQVPVPQVAVDPSCANVPVVKWNYGTKGNRTSYYKLILQGQPNGFWVSAQTTLYFKSGSNTGCCSKLGAEGVGCLFIFPT